MVALVSSLIFSSVSAGAVPVGENKAAFFDLGLEFVPGIDAKGIFLAEFERLFVDARLDLIEKVFNVRCYALERTRFFG